MSIADELQKLQQLRSSGALSEQEFQQAKQAVLASSSETRATPLEELLQDSSDNSLGTAANRYVSMQMVMSVIGLIIFLILFFTVFLPAFSRGPSFSPGPIVFPR